MSTEAETWNCKRCGAALPSIRGLCAACLARGALERDTGWLRTLVTPAKDNAEPVIVGWRIIGTLGAGGMGRVYHAESEEDGRAAAIKVLDRRWCDDPAMIGRFEKEARLLRQLDHENILRLLDTTETEDDRLCLITELVHGCDLGRLLRAETMPPERAMEIFDKVCAAVQHAHGRGLVHRDIKPSNILVGRDGAVKLADFGLARETGDDASVIGGLTATTDQFGTAYYLAPERMRGRCATGPEADVFSLGVLLYHLLSGHMPVGNYRPLSTLARVPEQVDAIVERALEADPTRRIASVTELRGRVMQLWRDHTAGVLRSRQLQRIATIAAACLFLIAAAAGGAWWQHQRSRPRPIVFANPAVATTDKPWVNSLGMKFVPVPGTDVLFSIYETRRSDVESFLREVTERRDVPWLENDMTRLQESIRSTFAGFRDDKGEWTQVSYREPGWEVTPEHPAICFSASDAIRYCLWLTWREQGEGRLKDGQRYRLPTVAEWFAACGGEDAELRPGNVAGPEAREGKWPSAFPTNGPGDPFPRTSPVGSFAPELHGIFDLSGNVCEWVTDGALTEPASGQGLRGRVVLRGPAFSDGESSHLNFRHIRRRLPAIRAANIGFRVVLDYKPTK